jgi:hypothetical protein
MEERLHFVLCMANQINQIVVRMLKPVVRIALKNSIKLGACVELLKAAYVEVANEILRATEHEPSISRVSVVSGVHRKDTKKILDLEGALAAPKEDVVTKVLGNWKHHKKFLTKQGKPRVLELDGLDSEFVKLVRSVSSDMAPYTVLYELERLGLVERSGNTVCLKEGFKTNIATLEEGYQHLALDLRDLVSSVDSNLHRSKDVLPNLHLRTEFTHIKQSALPGLRRWLLEEGAKFHRQVEEHLAALDTEVSGEAETKVARVVYGSFSLIQPHENEGRPQPKILKK